MTMAPDLIDIAEISVTVVDAEWDRLVPGAAGRAIRDVRAALDIACPTIGPAGVAIVLTDDATLRDLNRTWRAKDSPTNVLSFPATEIVPGTTPRAAFEGMPLELGDVLLAAGTCAREAAEQGKPIQHHFDHLIVHGVLHLLGYDHLEDQPAEAMERLEARILATLGVPDPYRSEQPHG